MDISRNHLRLVFCDFEKSDSDMCTHTAVLCYSICKISDSAG